MNVHSNIDSDIFPCTHCGYRANSMDDLKAHHGEAHKDSRSKGIYRSMYTRIHCDNCYMKFYTYEQRAHHEKTEHSEVYDSSSCETCNQEFLTKAAYYVHQGLHTPDNIKLFICHLCQSIFYDAHTLVQHHKDQHQKWPVPYFTCSGCDYVTKSLTDYDDHLANEHKNSETYYPYKCKECDFKTRCAKEIWSHIKNTGHGEIYQCKPCGTTYKNNEVLRKHIRKSHPIGQQSFICDLCGYKTNSRDNFTAHNRANHGTKKQCPYCEKTFKDKPKLDMHIDNSHPGVQPVEFQCEMCGKEFMFKASHTEHVYRHSYVRKKCPKRELSLDSEKRLQCSKCEVTFGPTSERLLLRHEYVAHGIKEYEFPNICKKCNQPYRQFHSVCTGVGEKKPVKCPYCGKGYASNENMQDHIKNLHMSERNFKCEICGKAYASKKTLFTHTKQSHNNQTCTICQKSLLNMFFLKKHLVFEHNITEGAFFCPVCPKKVFFSNKMFTKHMKENHPECKEFVQN